jgi:hypothetical protein
MTRSWPTSRKRDARDGGRENAPLTQAADAALLDTSEMTIEQAFDAARRIVETARARWETPGRANPTARLAAAGRNARSHPALSPGIPRTVIPAVRSRCGVPSTRD